MVGLVLLLPLAGAAVLLLFGRPLRRVAGHLATALVAASFAVAVWVTLDYAGLPGGASLRPAYDWISVGTLTVPVDLRVDPLSLVMILVVTGVGALIHWYSIGYMGHDERRATFFAYLNLFVFSMLVLVLADNFLLLYAGWELVGLCSFLLISFWYFRPSAAAAGKKAFITTRIGDLGLLIGIFLIFATFGTLDFDRVFGEVAGSAPAGAVATVIPLLLFAGAVGKSAQIPLHVWLPDAMEGPTPVSALIHAATMVTAGVYLVARTHVLFEASTIAATVVAVVGTVTALYAATIAVAQDDIKRVLAYSTISQLGYMFLAVGVGALTRSPVAYAAGMFHLVTHAFFKALLFLGAGSVMHATGDLTDMKRMGGLMRALPVTGATFVVGWLAIVGIPPFSGFFSKDLILAAAWEHGYAWLWALGIAAAVLTAFYTSRQVFLTFLGRPRLPEGVHPHESPPSMTVPLRALAALAFAGGAIGWGMGAGRIGRFLAPVFERAPAAGPLEAHPLLELSEAALALIALAAGLLGITLAHRLYLAEGSGERRARLRARLGGAVAAARSGYHVDSLYGKLLVLPAKGLAMGMADFDRRVIDGAVNGTGALVRGAASGMRRWQSGLVRRYVMAMLGGAVVIVAVFVVRAR